MVCASSLRRRGIGDGPVRLLEQRGCRRPIPYPLRPLRVCLVVGIPREPRRKLEETAIRDGVLGSVAVLVGRDLPAQATVAGRRVPARHLSVEHTLRKRHPRRLAIFLGEVELRRSHSGQPPEHLVVIAEVVTVVRREVIVVALLPEHTLSGDFVVRCVTGPEPVLNQSHEHGAALPPRIRQFPRNLAGLVASVVTHHVVGCCRSRILDRFCDPSIELAIATQMIIPKSGRQ